MDSILKFSEEAKKEAMVFAKSCLENNQDYKNLDFETQNIVLCLVVSCLTTFRLVQLANKLRGQDFFKD